MTSQDSNNLAHIRYDIEEVKKEMQLVNQLLFSQVTMMYMICKVLNHDKKTAQQLEELMQLSADAMEKRAKERT